MNTKLKKIAKTAAVGIFFMALFLNVKLSLTDPFINIDNAAIAQTTSSSCPNNGTPNLCCSYWTVGYPSNDCLTGGTFVCPHCKP